MQVTTHHCSLFSSLRHWIPFLLLISAIESKLNESFDLPLPLKQQQPRRCIINEHIILQEKESIKDPFVICGQIVCTQGGQVILKRCAPPELPEHCRPGKLLNVHSSFPDCCLRETECLISQVNNQKVWSVLPEGPKLLTKNDQSPDSYKDI